MYDRRTIQAANPKNPPNRQSFRAFTTGISKTDRGSVAGIGDSMPLSIDEPTARMWDVINKLLKPHFEGE